MGSFWEAIADVDVDIDWLTKTRTHLAEIAKEEAKSKRKRLTSPPRNSHLKKMVFEQFDEHLPHFQFKSDFLLYFNSRYSQFENLYTLVTMNKTCKEERECFFSDLSR